MTLIDEESDRRERLQYRAISRLEKRYGREGVSGRRRSGKKNRNRRSTATKGEKEKRLDEGTYIAVHSRQLSIENKHSRDTEKDLLFNSARRRARGGAAFAFNSRVKWIMRLDSRKLALSRGEPRMERLSAMGFSRFSVF